ncbi:recombinase family protein [Campylobacter helveticus]|uniref:recombinase family protein n=1 Tax=Campylobacter helveticus TaxID=28898 RepID=UPI0022EA26F8|nr:recombinase family protein [Campylobacter helveticus]
MVIAYARVSTDKQDNISQERLIKDYCEANAITLNDYISVEISSRKSQEKRQITQLTEMLNEGDTLITAELSRLGRDMFEVISLVFDLLNKGIKVIFIRQPELSLLKKSATKLLLSFYAYMAEYEREMISERTKAGLRVARNSGKTLGRRKGTFYSVYINDIPTIKELIAKDLKISDIWRFLGKKTSYVSFYSFCQRHELVKNFSVFDEHEEQIREYRGQGMPLNVIHRTLRKGTTANLRKFCQEKGIK